MAITLGDILRSNLLPNIEVLNTVPNFTDIPVELTSTQSIYELPIGHFIKARELVFSSSIGLAEEEEAYMTFIREISEGGGSGIIMAFKQADYRPSEQLLSHAAALQMPLFIIPWEYRFLDIQLAIANMLRSEQEREFNDLQATLLNLFFNAQPLDSAAESIAQKLKRPILIADRNEKIAGRSDKNIAMGDFPWTMAIENQDETVGFLTLCDAPVNETPDAELLRRYVCFPLMLWFFRKNVEEQATAQLKNDFVWNLANERYSSLEEAIYQGRLLHLDLTKSYTCLLLELQHDGSFSSAAILQQRSVQDLLVNTAAEMHLQLMLSCYGSQFILYLEYRNAPDYAPEHFIDLVTPALSEQFPGSKLFWGISEPPADTTDFAAAHHHALQALSYALRSKKQRYRFTYHDTKEAQITYLLSQNAALQEEAFAVIEKLVKYSDPSGIDLFGTLQMFMECNYNISQTARNLYIHRQSLLYRLSKIEELTGMSLHDHRSLFLLDIYAHIYAGY